MLPSHWFFALDVRLCPCPHCDPLRRTSDRARILRPARHGRAMQQEQPRVPGAGLQAFGRRALADRVHRRLSVPRRMHGAGALRHWVLPHVHRMCGPDHRCRRNHAAAAGNDSRAHDVAGEQFAIRIPCVNQPVRSTIGTDRPRGSLGADVRGAGVGLQGRAVTHGLRRVRRRSQRALPRQ